jgi:hypothetical protein
MASLYVNPYIINNLVSNSKTVLKRFKKTNKQKKQKKNNNKNPTILQHFDIGINRVAFFIQ